MPGLHGARPANAPTPEPGHPAHRHNRCSRDGGASRGISQARGRPNTGAPRKPATGCSPAGVRLGTRCCRTQGAPVCSTRPGRRHSLPPIRWPHAGAANCSSPGARARRHTACPADGAAPLAAQSANAGSRPAGGTAHPGATASGTAACRSRRRHVRRLRGMSAPARPEPRAHRKEPGEPVAAVDPTTGTGLCLYRRACSGTYCKARSGAVSRPSVGSSATGASGINA